MDFIIALVVGAILGLWIALLFIFCVAMFASFIIFFAKYKEG
jgi:hypothetical protein